MHRSLLLLIALAGCEPHVDTSARALEQRPGIDRPALAELSLDREILDRATGHYNPLIVGGQPTDTDPAVALLLAVDANDDILGICSGTLIAPRRVLTAAHCIDGRIPGAVGLGVYFGTELSSTDPGFVFLTDAESVVFHPQWNPANLEGGHDIGLVFLREAPPIQPIPFRTAPLTDADLGAELALVGWGLTGGGADDSGIKRFASSTLQAFDALLLDVGDANVGTCSGDSGGPAFLANANGVEEVVGVTSFGDVDCAQTSIDTRVDAFKQFIASDGQQLDDPTGPGGTPGGFGAGCAVADDCASGVCVVDGASGFCSELCEVTALADSCPAGASCQDFDGTSACVPDDQNDAPVTPPLPRADDGGCSAAGGAGSTAALVLLGLLAGLRRRRRDGAYCRLPCPQGCSC